MSTLNFGTTASLTVGASITAGQYDVTGTAYDCTVGKPFDVLIDYAATVGASAGGNLQILLFLVVSTDGTNYSSAPSSATDATRDSQMYLLGAIPVASSQAVRKTFSVANALGFIPAKFKLYVKADLTTAGLSSCSAQTREITTA
jgi:hypothetical protein